MNINIKRTLTGIIAITALCCSAPASGTVFHDVFPVQTVSAEETVFTGKCGKNVTYTFDSQTGKLTITGNKNEDPNKDNKNKRNDWINQWAMYDNAFCKYTNQQYDFTTDQIKSVEISGITKISYRAFAISCTNLEEVYIKDSVEVISSGAFQECPKLKSISLPDGLVELGGAVFNKCTSLTSISLPDTLTEIKDNSLFSDCTSLRSVKLPSSLTSIPNYSFSGCSALTSITIPDSVTYIGIQSFDKCTNLKTISIPSSVTEIRESAFDNTVWLSDQIKTNPMVIVNGILINGEQCEGEVTVPDTVTEISFSAFKNNKKITGLNLPGSVLKIDNAAFYGCKALKNVSMSESITVIGSNAFSDCKALTSIDLPDSLTEIGSYVFNGCEALEDVNIPQYVSSLGTSIFSSCVSIKSITIPDSVTGISDSLFRNCSGLETVTIPKSVKAINKYAFDKCDNLKTIKYAGSDIDWQNISKGQYNTPLEDAEIIYDYTLLQSALILASDGTAGIRFKCSSDINEFILNGQNITEEIKKNAKNGCCIKDYYVPMKDYKKQVVLSVDGSTLKCSISILIDRYQDSSEYKANEKLKNLVDSIEEFCKASNAYFYNANVNAPKTEPSIDHAYDAVYSNNKISGIEYYGSSLLLKSQTVIRHYFRIADGKAPENFTVSVKQGSSSISGIALKSYDDKYCYMDITGVAAANLDKLYDVTVSDGKDSIRFSYGALSYCIKAISNESTNENLANLCKKMYIYADAAKKYMASFN